MLFCCMVGVVELFVGLVSFSWIVLVLVVDYFVVDVLVY